MVCKLKQTLFYCTMVLIIILTSCVKEDISNLNKNVLINQSFSVPFGPSDLKIYVPSVIDTSSVPGRYGSFYYNGNIYPNNMLYFTINYDINFTLSDKNASEKWIKRVVFHLLGVNSFPTQMYLQVYIYNQRSLLDSVFVNGQVILEPAVVNAQGDIEQTTSALIDVPFEGARLTMLKQATDLVYQGKFLSTGGKYKPMRLSDNNNLLINIALQVELQYNLNDATK